MLAELDAERAHLTAVEAIDPAGLSPTARSSATSSSTTSAARSSTRTCSDSGSDARSRSTRSATGSSCCSPAITPRSPSGSTPSPAGSRRSRRTSRKRRPGRAVPQVRRWQRVELETAAELPSFFDELVAAGVGVVPDAEQRRLGARRRGGQDRRRPVRDVAGRHARRRHRRLADRSRAARRDGRAARVRRPRCRRDPGARLGTAQRGARGAGGGRPRDRPGRRRADGHRPGQVRSAADLRRCARRLPRGDAPLAPAPDRPRPRDGPGRRADRRHRDARVPAQRHPVRRVLRAGGLRPRPEGHLHRDAVGRRRPERDARAQLRLDQQHQHPRGLSGPPSPARRRPPEPFADPAPRRRARVHRGLGDVLGAADARARLRRRRPLPAGHAHRRDLAGVPDHPRRPDASRRAERRGGDRLPGRAHPLRAPERRGRGRLVHVPADLSPVLPARPDAPARPARRRAAPPRRRLQPQGRSTTRCCGTARCRSASTGGC